MTIRNILSRLRQIAQWFWRGKYHLFSCAGVIVSVMYLTKVITFYPSIVALILTLTGLFLILALQMLDAKEYADHKPNTVLNWLKSFPRFKNITLVAGTGAFAVTGGKARVSVSVAANATLEKKVDFLIRQFAVLESQIANVDDRVDEVKSSLNKSEKELQGMIGDISSSISSQIAGHVVGAYDINLFAITITVCGTLIQLFSA